MSDTALQTKKAQADRELVSKFIDNTDAYEKAVSLGFSLDHITEPGSRRAAEVIQQHYDKHGRVVPDFRYLEDMAVPFSRVLVATDVERTLARVKAMAVQLRLSQLGGELSPIASRDIHAAVKALQDRTQQIGDLSRSTPLPATIEQLIEDDAAEYDALERGEALSLPMAWEPLNAMTRGKSRGYPHVFYGAAKNFKSTVLLYDAYRTAALGYRVYLATGELAPRDLMTMLLCFHGNVSLTRRRQGRFTSDEKMRYAEARVTLPQLPLKIGRKSFPGYAELDLIASEAQKFGADQVSFDGAHRGPPSRKHEDIAQYATRITEHAARMDVPWVIATQANRARKQGVSDSTKMVDSASEDIGGSIAWLQEVSWAIRCVKTAPGQATLEVTESRFATSDINAVSVIIRPGENMGIVPRAGF